MKLPKLQQLKYLVALYDTGHFGQAAKKCFVSQSTLSSAIQALEEQLDSQLIERDHKTFVFTPLGIDVVQKARLILEQSAELVAISSSQGNQYSGELHLGMIPTIAPFLLSPLIKQFSETFPNLTLYLREGTTEECLSLLREGKLDLVLMATPYETSEFVECTLASDPFYRVFHNERPDGAIYLLEKEHCLTEHTLSGCNLVDTKELHPFQASSLNTLLAMVEGHSGQTYLPELAIKSGILDNTQLSHEAIDTLTANRKISLVWRKTSSRRSFFNEIAKVLQTLIENKLN
jgi:LysR family hydrogen peroxide-inducible transcriptional activator